VDRSADDYIAMAELLHWFMATFVIVLFVLFISDWAMVSAAQPPFDFPTVLYGVIAWPYLSAIEKLTTEVKKRLNLF
jgi:hypothetical protein